MSLELENPFTPNVAIKFDNFSEILAFEDIVASLVEPDMTIHQTMHWQGRDSIRELLGHPKIKGKPFNGRMLGIEIVPLENPYEKLVSARDEKWKLKTTRLGSSDDANMQYRASRCLGFHFTAIASSTGRGVIGEVQAGLWYLPVPKHLKNGKIMKNTGSNGGRSITRIVTQLRLEEENFIRLNEDSSRIAIQALIKNMKQPLRIGMHN